jgi:AraC-like DNA-binding protein
VPWASGALRPGVAMAIDWNSVKARILWGERTRCEPSWRLGRRGPDSSTVVSKYSLWFVWAGRGTVQLRHSLVPLRTGICLWMRPGGKYLVEQDLEDRLGVSAVHFDLVDPEGRQVAPDEAFPPEVHDLPDVTFTDAVLKRVVELLGHLYEPRSQVGSPDKETATLLLTGLLHQDGASRQRQHEMLRLAALIRENSGSLPSIKELADEAGYTADHFARLFESVVGQSPQAYAVQVRINRARQLLLSTDLSVSEIADALGYQDVFFFSRQFKQKVGVPPSRYRRHAAELSVQTA